MERAEDQTERFAVEACLGSGTSGSVYRAHDRVRNATVAIKVLQSVDAGSLFRFKGEFRQLANISHRNLLQLYELTASGHEWILSMELIEGCDFLSWVRPAESAASSLLSEDDDLDTLPPELVARACAAERPANQNARSMRPPSAKGVLDVARLQAALRQLAEGLRALHAQQRLHRDLKPANVLVAAEDGRVVICDFGLVSEQQAPREAMTRALSTQQTSVGTYTDTQVAGTLAYMAPEQASGLPLSEASDWYAVGVMLYQALTGRLPVDPKLGWKEAVQARMEPPVDPRALAPEVPAELAALALSLLRYEAATRAGYVEVLAALGGGEAVVALRPVSATPLFGREQQLAQLHTAFERVMGGEATVALVAGRSGMGKSALMARFIAELEERHGAIVLSGRCYEREDLPFKAIDPLMDALSTRLLKMDPEEVAELVPDGTEALARMFPVLSRVPVIAQRTGDARDLRDPHELRRAAFQALRELCRRLSQRGPLLLYVDDLQWGDLDSGPLLAELLRRPHAPALLLVGAYRSEDAESAALLRALRETHLASAGVRRPVEIALDPLDDGSLRALARSLLAPLADPGSAVELVAAESAGSPLFARELAAYALHHGLGAAKQLRLDGIIESRVRALPSHARALLSVLAVAGAPERIAIVDSVAKLGAETMRAHRVLAAQQLIHGTGSEADDRVETYHDKIRETAYRMLSDEERRALHGALAHAIEARDLDRADPDVLLEHWRAAGERGAMAKAALRAAEKAESSLAFSRAAQLYELAVDEHQGTGEERRALIERLASALSRAGRGPDAADAYIRALEGASVERATELRSLATTQLFRAGLMPRGFAELKKIEHLLGMRVPETPLRAIAMLLYRRLLIRLRGLRLRTRAGGLSAELRQRMDLLWGLAGGLAAVDQLLANVFQSEHLLLALRSGDRYRYARAVAMETTTWATGNTHPARTQRIMDHGLEMSGAARHPHALSAIWGATGVCRMLEGRFLEAIRLTRQAQAIQRERLGGSYVWDRVITQVFEMRALALVGNVRELSQTVPELLRDAEARGDLFAAVSLRTSNCCWAWLGPDQLDAAKEQVAIADRGWVQVNYSLQSWYTTQAHASIALYEGKVEEARARLARDWKSLFMLRKKIQLTRADTQYMRARLDIAASLERGDRSLLAGARADAKALLREKAPWIIAHGRLLSACVDSFDRPERAIATLFEVEGQFEAVDMKLMAVVCAYRRGQLIGGEEGATTIAFARQAMAKLGVSDVEAFARMLAPGFPSAHS